MQRCRIETNEIYHIYNRGVDKRIIFTEKSDYSYFVHLLYALNDTSRSYNTKRNFSNFNKNDRGSTSIIGNGDRRRLVDIIAFVLMPNHFHLLLKQKEDGGIAKFMQKIGTGYTMIFNEKNNRSGSLFQGRYKSVHISSNKQLRYIPHYIHLNPIALFDDDEKVNVIEKLKKYKWSSFPDYCNIKNFPSITEREFVLSIFKGSQQYVKDIKQFVNNKKSFSGCDSSAFIDYQSK